MPSRRGRECGPADARRRVDPPAFHAPETRAVDSVGRRTVVGQSWPRDGTAAWTVMGQTCPRRWQGDGARDGDAGHARSRGWPRSTGTDPSRPATRRPSGRPPRAPWARERRRCRGFRAKRVRARRDPGVAASANRHAGGISPERPWAADTRRLRGDDTTARPGKIQERRNGFMAKLIDGPLVSSRFPRRFASDNASLFNAESRP
jgi:hypothetical protein